MFKFCHLSQYLPSSNFLFLGAGLYVTFSCTARLHVSLNLGEFPSLSLRWHFLRIQARQFVECPSVWISLLIPHD